MKLEGSSGSKDFIHSRDLTDHLGGMHRHEGGLQLEGPVVPLKTLARLQKNCERLRDVIYGRLSDEVEITLTVASP